MSKSNVGNGETHVEDGLDNNNEWKVSIINNDIS